MAIVVALSALILIPARVCFACSCVKGLANEEALRESKGVYEAKLVDVDRVIPAGGSRLYQHRATFLVKRIFSGPDRGLIRIPAYLGPEGSCGIEKVEIGQTWVLLHSGPEYRFRRADACTRLSQSTPEALATAMAVFGEGRPVPEEARESEGPLPGGPVQGESVPRKGMNGITAVALTLVITLSLAWLARGLAKGSERRRSAP